VHLLFPFAPSVFEAIITVAELSEFEEMGQACCTLDPKQQQYVSQPKSLYPQKQDKNGAYSSQPEQATNFKSPGTVSKFNGNNFLGALFPENLLNHIGSSNCLGPLSSIQLLDLMAWFEVFGPGGHIQMEYPWIWRSSMQEYFNNRPDLGRSKVNLESESDVKWVNQHLDDFYRLARQEFLGRARNQMEDFLDNVYAAQRRRYTFQNETKMASSLCEDVFHFAGIQMMTVRDHSSEKSNILADVASLLFVQLRAKQVNNRDNFLHDLESACAAANDYYRMSEKAEDLMEEIKKQCIGHADVESTLDDSLSALLDLYGTDAVYAAQSCHTFVFKSIEDSIGDRLFDREWEENLTQNQHAVTIVKTMQDFAEDLKNWLDPFLYFKFIDSIVMATSVFYVKHLVLKAETYKEKKGSVFGDNSGAIARMKGDIKIFRDYFESLQQVPNLTKTIKRELGVLDIIIECLATAGTATATSYDEASQMMNALYFEMHGDLELTKRLVGDLWHLAAPSNEVHAWKYMKHKMQWATIEGQSYERSDQEGLKLDMTLRAFYKISKRKIPKSMKKKLKEKIQKVGSPSKKKERSPQSSDSSSFSSAARKLGFGSGNKGKKVVDSQSP